VSTEREGREETSGVVSGCMFVIIIINNWGEREPRNWERSRKNAYDRNSLFLVYQT